MYLCCVGYDDVVSDRFWHNWLTPVIVEQPDLSISDRKHFTRITLT